MLRIVRRKIASSLSEIQLGEDFLYNSWLREHPHTNVAIGSLSSAVNESLQVGLSIDEPYASQHFFLLPEAELYPEDNIYFFQKVKTNAIFFTLLIVPSKVFYHNDLEQHRQIVNSVNYDFSFASGSGYDIPVRFALPEPVDYRFALIVPASKDYLESLRVKVVEIKLLKMDELFKGGGIKSGWFKIGLLDKLKIKKLKIKPITNRVPKIFKVRVPEVGKFRIYVSKLSMKEFNPARVSKTPNLSIKAPLRALNNFNFECTNSLKFYDAHSSGVEEVLTDELQSLKSPEAVKDVVSLILKKAHKVTWEKREKATIVLKKHEDEMAKFLSESDYAFLGAERGIDRIKASVAALDFLFNNKIIHSALIVSNKYEIGTEKIDPVLQNQNGWIGKLNTLAPGLSTSIIKGDDDERADAWHKSALVYLADYKTVVNDFNLNIVEQNRLNKFDCIIFDEVQEAFELEKSGDFLRAVKPAALWTLSSVIKEELIGKLNDAFNNDVAIGHKKLLKLNSVSSDDERIIINEYWLHFDEHQLFEYKETLKECRKELKRVLESGNPFRFQANIFTLLHQLYQVSNFAHGYDESPKSELLMHHLRIIKENEDKVIIISQYYRRGTKKLENLLDKQKISYVSAPNGLSNDELKKAISLFKTKKSVTAFVTNIKENRLDFGSFVVPYVIRFDSWWNPAVVFRTADMFDHNIPSDKNNKIRVFTYNMLDSIEEKVKVLMLERGLTDDNILQTLPVNKFNELIRIEDWLEIFEMPVERTIDMDKLIADTVEQLRALSLADYRATLSRFFFVLGYTNIDILEHENSASFDITGEAKIGRAQVHLFGRVILEKEVTANHIRQLAIDTSGINGANIFIFTKGEFSDNSRKLAAIRKNITLMDDKRLAKYLVNLNLIQTS